MRQAFAAAVEPQCFYASQMHLDALAGVIYVAAHRVPAAILTGPSGSGKTAVLSTIEYRVARQRAPVQTLLLRDPFLTPATLLRAVSRLAGGEDASGSLVAPLRRMRQRGRIPLLLVDDAHRLEPAALDQLRVFTEWTVDGEALLPVVLSGTAGLESSLPLPVTQATDLRLELAALNAGEVAAYIEYRWQCCSNQPLPFTRAALRFIAEASEGLPRVVNRLCREALRQALSTGAGVIDENMIRQPAARRRTRRVVSLAKAGSA